MKKMALIGTITSGIILLAVAGNGNKPQSSITNNQNTKPTNNNTITPQPILTCDGKNITSDCKLKGVKYKTYIYHAAIPEESHTQQVTTYKKKIIGYCTLCNDGTYSPSCATGSGACSYHNGVAQWNAPQYGSVPVYSNKKVIDSPAQKAYIEKVTH